MSTRREAQQNLVFDEVADLYERARPQYPEPFIDEVCRRAGLEPGARILEIGCGPGTATRSFAERGYAMRCLEPGRKMAELARRRLAHHGHVEVETTTFEAWEERGRRFSLVLAAQSFHWVDPEIGFSKAAAVLEPGGALAVIANLPQHGTSPVRTSLDEVYARFGSEFAPHAYAPGAVARLPLRDLLAAAPEFGEVECVSHPWTRRYDTAAYLELMQTQSDHRMLPEATLRELLAGIAVALDAHGGSIAVEYEARLLLAKGL